MNVLVEISARLKLSLRRPSIKKLHKQGISLDNTYFSEAQNLKYSLRLHYSFKADLICSLNSA